MPPIKKIMSDIRLSAQGFRIHTEEEKQNQASRQTKKQRKVCGKLLKKQKRMP